MAHINPRAAQNGAAARAARESRVLFDHPGQPTREDLTFEHIPFGHEVLRHGGLPGVEYCWVAPESTAKFLDAGPNDEGFTWAQVRDWHWPITIVGPRGSVRAAQLFARGAPIPSASPHSSTRRWFVYNVILERTGHAMPGFIPHNHSEEEKQELAYRVKNTGKLVPGPKLAGGGDRYQVAGDGKANRAVGS